jgi:hypothetical protein
VPQDHGQIEAGHGTYHEQKDAAVDEPGEETGRRELEDA